MTARLWSLEPAESLGPFRAKVLVRTFAIVTPVTLVAAFLRFGSGPLVRSPDPLLLRAGAALLALWLMRPLPYRARAVGLVLVLSMLAAAGYVELGPFGPGRILFLGVAFLSTVLLSPLWGAGVVAGAAVLFGLVPPGAPADHTNPRVWVPSDVVVVLLLLAVVTPVATLLEELGASLLEARRLVEREREAQERAEQAAASLAQARACMEAIVHNSPAVIYVKDLAGRFLLSNRELERRLGRAKADIIGKTDYDLFSTHYADTFRKVDLAVIQAGKPVREREEAPGPAGIRQYLSTKFPVRDTRGHTYALGGISTDITALAEMELLTTEYETIFTKAFSVCPDAIALFDATDGKIAAVNPGFCALFGYSEEEAIGKTAAELSLWSSPDGDAARDSLAVSGALRERELSVQTRSGAVKACEVSSTLLEQRGSRTVLTVIRDVSAKRRAEAELLKLNEDLEARVAERTAALEATHRELDAFSRAVSHDLRAPLARISEHAHGIAARLAETQSGATGGTAIGGADAAEGRRLAGVIVGSAAKMNTLIDDLLRLAHLGKVELTLEDVDLQSLCKEIAGELMTQHPERKVDWSIEALPTVTGDRALLRQAFVNLLDNALKYTRRRDPARIVVAAEATTDAGVDGYRLSVRDNGEGFDQSYASRLFQVFQRLHPDFEGTGVGLATVKRIVSRHGGSVRAEGERGVGATVSIFLPKTL